LIGVVAVAVGLSAGLVLGSVAGYLGGKVDSVVMRLMDIMLAIPGLLLAIGIVALLGQGLYQIMNAVGAANVPIFARLLRVSVLGFNLIGDGLREALDPKLRGRVGRFRERKAFWFLGLGRRRALRGV